MENFRPQFDALESRVVPATHRPDAVAHGASAAQADPAGPPAGLRVRPADDTTGGYSSSPGSPSSSGVPTNAGGYTSDGSLTNYGNPTAYSSPTNYGVPTSSGGASYYGYPTDFGNPVYSGVTTETGNDNVNTGLTNYGTPVSSGQPANPDYTYADSGFGIPIGQPVYSGPTYSPPGDYTPIGTPVDTGNLPGNYTPIGTPVDTGNLPNEYIPVGNQGSPITTFTPPGFLDADTLADPNSMAILPGFDPVGGNRAGSGTTYTPPGFNFGTLIDPGDVSYQRGPSDGSLSQVAPGSGIPGVEATGTSSTTDVSMNPTPNDSTAPTIAAGNPNDILFSKSATDPTYGVDPIGTDKSYVGADADLKRVSNLKGAFIEVGQEYNLPPALLAAIASRESNVGRALGKGANDPGYGGGAGNDPPNAAYGIMQVDITHSGLPGGVDTTVAPDSIDNIRQGAQVLAAKVQAVQAANPDWTQAQVLRGAVAAYNTKIKYITDLGTLDNHTTGHDYSADVWARAQTFADSIFNQPSSNFGPGF